MMFGNSPNATNPPWRRILSENVPPSSHYFTTIIMRYIWLDAREVLWRHRVLAA